MKLFFLLFPCHYQVSKWVGDSRSNHGFLITTTHVFNNRVEHNLVKFAKSQGTLQESRNALLVLFTNSNKRKSSSFVTSPTSKFTREQQPCFRILINSLLIFCSLLLPHVYLISVFTCSVEQVWSSVLSLVRVWFDSS